MLFAIIPHLYVHAIVLMVFTIVYISIGFHAHFAATQPDAPLTGVSPLYFGLSTHTLLGDNSCIARTDTARLLVMTHALLAWAVSLAALGTLIGDVRS